MTEIFEVLRGFKTATRRFAPGQTVTATDLDGSLTAADWIRLGCLRAPQIKPAPAAKPPADPATD